MKKILVVVILIIAVVLGVFSYKVYNILLVSNTNFSTEREEIFIRTNTSFSELLQQLSPFLKNEKTFAEVARQKGYSTHVKAGRYFLIKGMNNNEIVNTLRSGNTPVKVAFNNQERVENLAGRISQQIEADSISLLNAFIDKAFLDQNEITLPNALSIYLPNTYEFYWNTSAEQFRNRMLKESQKFWNQDRLQKAQKQGLTPAQVITLASIVQKETAKEEERPRVAGVYLNRLKKNMLLQADPTVIFGVKEQTGKYDTIIRRVLHKTLTVNSLYNTYKYSGLPPGPITMPDITSIEAVLNPEIHEYYYFVADTENIGYHKFSRTLEQHTQYSKQYHNWVNLQGIKQ